MMKHIITLSELMKYAAPKSHNEMFRWSQKNMSRLVKFGKIFITDRPPPKIATIMKKKIESLAKKF